jgi:hypothetical protein
MAMCRSFSNGNMPVSHIEYGNVLVSHGIWQHAGQFLNGNMPVSQTEYGNVPVPVSHRVWQFVPVNSQMATCRSVIEYGNVPVNSQMVTCRSILKW